MKTQIGRTLKSMIAIKGANARKGKFINGRPSLSIKWHALNDNAVPFATRYRHEREDAYMTCVLAASRVFITFESIEDRDAELAELKS